MRVPLLLGAVPKLIDKNTPVVPMREGMYKIESDGLVDSIFEIQTSNGLKSDDHSIILETPSNCFVYFINVGSEKLLSVYLRRIAA